MSYRVISGEVKVDVVLKLFQGESPGKLEKEFNIPKKTMYIWKTKAIEIMYKIFAHNPPGPKKKNEEKLHKCDTLSQSNFVDSCECPECKRGNLVKNGAYTLNSGIVKQRLFCKLCFFQISIEKKTIEFR